MNMKYTGLFSWALFAIWALASCSGGSGDGSGKSSGETAQMDSTASGVKYTVLKATDGPSPQAGDRVTMHYRGLLTDSTQFDSSLDRGEPFEFRVGMGQVIKGWDEIVPMMKKGEKWRIVIPPDMGYGARGAGNAIPPNATLIFEMELLDFTSPVTAKPFDVEGLSAQEADGLTFFVVTPGSGDKPTAGDFVEVHYSGYFEDGKKFDSSVDRGEPIEFELGQGRVIDGWEKSLLDMQVGEKRRVVIPPALAYGAEGKPPRIPANATLTFDMELISFRTPREPEPIDISGVEAQTDNNGMRYHITSTDGEPITQGTPCNFHITLYGPDGSVMRSTVTYERPVMGYPLGRGDQLFDPILKQLTTQGAGRFYPTQSMLPQGTPMGLYVDIKMLGK